MPTKKFLLPLLLFVSAFTLPSCKKETTVSNSDQLTGTWAVVGIRSDRPYDWDRDGYTETDIFNTYSFCQRDIILSFTPGGYGEARQGCDAPWENMSWQLTNSRLDIYIPSGDINLSITQFDGNTIQGYDPVQVNGSTYHITYTLSKRY